MIDPRENIIDLRLKNVKRVIAVTGGKGGIGKSVISSTLALVLAKNGSKVGLLDLDFCGPSAHTILGIQGVQPEEKNGIVPPEFHKIKFMSIVYYTGAKPLPVRGIDISNAIIELFTITQWGNLDFLIIDMPPGTGDELLDITRLVPKIEFIIVTTRSKVVLETVKKTVALLKEQKFSIIGVIENMRFVGAGLAPAHLDIKLLGVIEFDRDFENAVGDVAKLLKTKLIKNVERITKAVF